MGAQIIDGKKISGEIRKELAVRVENFEKRFSYRPGLAVIIVGEDPASQVYVRNKIRGCAQVGIHSEGVELPADTSEEELFAVIDRFNNDRNINGILVQFPVPAHLSERRIVERIDPVKDVDGLSDLNAGKLMSGKKGLVSCTPKGVIELIKRTGTDISGKNAVVIGRSNLVGKPLSMLLLHENATVTMCHSRTQNMKEITSKADILVSAVGKPGLVKGDFVKPGAVVIDVGTSSVDGKLKGDCEFDEVAEIAGFITPVPGGVGPMTITMLLSNTIDAAYMQENAEE